MADSDDEHHEGLVSDGVENAVVADADAED